MLTTSEKVEVELRDSLMTFEYGDSFFVVPEYSISAINFYAGTPTSVLRIHYTVGTTGKSQDITCTREKAISFIQEWDAKQ